MEIVKVATYNPGLTQAESLKEVEKRGLRLLTNKEADAILQDKKVYEQYKDYFPLWVGTSVEIDGTNCKITEGGKSVQKTIPDSDGWYEQDDFGMPFGASSNRENKDARYLWRVKKYKGLVSRDGWWGDDGRRYVFCFDGSSYDLRLGVLATPAKAHKHRWETVCADCEVKR